MKDNVKAHTVTEVHAKMALPENQARIERLRHGDLDALKELFQAVLGLKEQPTMKDVDSSDFNAPLPGIGGVYVWRLDTPYACELLQVVKVEWNGEEWWVTTKRLHDSLRNTSYPNVDQASQLNELGRFWEAVTPVRETRGSLPRPAHVQDRPCPCGDPECGE